jgi:hypothetical protein
VSDVTVSGVRSAVAECRRIGRFAFLEKYGFKQAREYYLLVEGERYDSKAILGAAHGYDRPDLGPLRSSKFSGGASHAAKHLQRLGFVVVQDPSG